MGLNDFVTLLRLTFFFLSIGILKNIGGSGEKISREVVDCANKKRKQLETTWISKIGWLKWSSLCQFVGSMS